MAFLTKRWPWMLIVAASAIAVAYLPPQRPEESDPDRGEWQSYPTPEARLAKRLGDDYSRMADRQHVRTVRDSLMRVLSSRPERTGTVIGLSPRRELDSITQALARVATPPIPLNPEVRASIALVPTTLARWDATYNVYLPTSTDGRTCIATHPVDATKNRLSESFRARQALGACAFFAAFGLPGREIEQWLAARDYNVAMDPDWQLPRHTPPPADELSAIQWVEFTLARAGLAPRPEFFYEIEEGSVYWDSFTGSACAAGDRVACQQYFFSTPPAPDMRHRGMPVPGVIPFRPWWSSQAYGALAALVRDQGPDRFAKFWRSNLPPEQAFDHAFTVPFDRWAPGWARTVYGAVRIDVRTRPREVASTLLWIGLCVGVCVGLALSRRVA